MTSASIPALLGHPTNLMLKLLQQRGNLHHREQVVRNIPTSHISLFAGLTNSQRDQRGEELGLPSDRYFSGSLGSRLHHLETGIQSLASDANYCTLRLDLKINSPRSPFRNLRRIRIKFGRTGKFHIGFSPLTRKSGLARTKR